MRTYLASKIRNLVVTDACVNYEGSITIGRQLMRAADINEHEQVHVLDLTNGERLITYAIEGEDNECCVNGAAAWKVNIGDRLIVLTYHTSNVSKKIISIDFADFMQPRGN